MRVVVQNVANDQYYAGTDRWTDNPAAAVDFETGRRAQEFCEAQPDASLRIVFKYVSRDRPDVVFPVERRQ